MTILTYGQKMQLNRLFCKSFTGLPAGFTVKTKKPSRPSTLHSPLTC